MLEREPTLPHATMFLRDWCDQYGIDRSQYDTLMWHDIRIAPLRSQELPVAEKLRQEIESNLPLEGCELVDDPRLLADQVGLRPKVYLAPQGMAFRLETTYEYEQLDEWDDPVPGAAKQSITQTLIGEYLGIETRVIGGEPEGHITVIEHPNFYALPLVNMGGDMFGPNASTIRLPSRNDSEKKGAYVFFDRLDGWEVVHSGDELEGKYGASSVLLVPHQKTTVDELYIADFGQYNDFALDDFLFRDEVPVLPPGFIYLPKFGGGVQIIHNEVLTLVLPPLEREDWSDLWYQHGIMIKFNPTVREPRFLYLDFSRRLDTDFELRRFNTFQSEDRMFQRAIVVRNVGTTSLDDVVLMVTSQDKFSEEEYKRFA